MQRENAQGPFSPSHPDGCLRTWGLSNKTAEAPAPGERPRPAGGALRSTRAPGPRRKQDLLVTLNSTILGSPARRAGPTLPHCSGDRELFSRLWRCTRRSTIYHTPPQNIKNHKCNEQQTQSKGKYNPVPRPAARWKSSHPADLGVHNHPHSPATVSEAHVSDQCPVGICCPSHRQPPSGCILTWQEGFFK